MSEELVRKCDYKRDRGGERCGQPGVKPIEVMSGNRVFHLDVCQKDFADAKAEVNAYEAALVAIGFTVLSKTASKLRRAYVANSGRTFTTNEARDWLAAKGYEVPSAGRLSAEMLQVYAEAN